MVKEEFKLDNQLCFRLYTASRLLTQAYHPLLSRQPVNDIAKRLLLETNTVTPLLQRMEKEGLLIRKKGKEDARQMIVRLTSKGKRLQESLSDVPATVGGSVLCESVTPETVPDLFRMLDDMIARLKA